MFRRKRSSQGKMPRNSQENMQQDSTEELQRDLHELMSADLPEDLPKDLQEELKDGLQQGVEELAHREWNVEFRAMQLDDIPQIMEVELESFTVPWSPEAFRNELKHNKHAHYIVMVLGERIIGYAGMWLMIDEAHITNVAIRERYRGQRLGQKMLRRLIDAARLLGAERMTLEVRVSNRIAQSLYEKFGFHPVGVRKGYYSDNKEDALIMWADIIENRGQKA